MVKSRFWAALAASFLAACSTQPRVDAAAPRAGVPASASGIVLQNMDTAVRAQDDLYRHVNGRWLDATEIPPDKAQYGAWVEVIEKTLDQLRAIVESGEAPADAQARSVADLYASFMDEARLEALGLKPLAAEFARIDAIRDKAELPALIAHYQRIGVSMPYDLDVHQDAKDSTRYIVDLGQGGLGMPDRDYYLKDDDAKLAEVRARYHVYVQTMLRMVGDAQPAASAQEILALETALARVQWTRVENRDPVKTYNPMAFAKLEELAPGYDWGRYRAAAWLEGKVDGVVVSQPPYLAGCA